MPIPDFQTIMLPLLQLSGDEAVHTFADASLQLSTLFQLTEGEKEALLSSGKYPIFRHRVAWAKTYLTKAKLLESPARGSFKITQLGKELLQSPPAKITSAYLRRYPEFASFHGSDNIGKNSSVSPVIIEVPEETPDELLENAYGQLRKSLAADLLEQVKQVSPSYFEKLVVDLLVAMGYGGSVNDAAQVVGKSGDGGIDGIIKEDHLGLGAVYIQAKKWENTVPRPEIQKFVGALHGNQATKGVFITTSTFSDGAKEYVKNLSSKVVLIDGELLAKYMIDFNVGVSVRQSYQVKKIDMDYFAEE